MPNRRTRIIDFAQETAERGDALMTRVSYQNIAGSNPCVRTYDWNGFDLRPPAFEPSTAKTIWELPDLTDAWLVTENEHPLVEQARIRAQMGAKIKLWHDDVREPPDDSWLWARDNADAMVVLAGEYLVDVLSMDHDLGGSIYSLADLAREKDRGNDPDFMAIEGSETGVELAEFIGRNDLYPAEIIIHSMNPVGAGNIISALQRYAENTQRTCIIRLEPFSR